MSSALGVLGLAVRPVSVWVEAGREGRLLSYDGSAIDDLQAGDLVSVRLRGRLHTGLISSEVVEVPAGVALEPVLERLESAAVDPAWQQLLQEVSERCHTAPFQVLKTALPSGWLGQKRSGSSHGRRQLVAELCQTTPPESHQKELTSKQQQLLEHLQQQGPRSLSELEQNGLSRSVVKALEQRQFL